jgi:hypothetical protein
MKELFKGQVINYFLLYFLLAGVYQIIANFPGFLDGNYWGLASKYWLLIALLSPILHQLFVWFCWRFEMHRGLLTKWFGDKAFLIYKIDFTLLILSRPLVIILLALSNKNSLDMDQTTAYLLALILGLPAIYLFYSVRMFFGFDRAYGIDHFDPESVKSLPMVRQGIFKYTSNGMYVFGFFILYLPGLIWLSKTALLVAVFNHLYIWVHYYFTEKPDMALIYGDSGKSTEGRFTNSD